MKSFRKLIRKVWALSIIKTLWFNLHYFGWRGIHCYVLVSKYVILDSLHGNVELREKRFGIVQIGFPSINIFDSKYERTVWSNSGDVVFLGKAYLGQGTRITSSGRLEFGDKVIITANTSVLCAKHIAIGSDSQISWDCIIMDTDLHPIYIKGLKKRVNDPAEIILGNNVWVGCRSTILKGTVVKEGCIVAAGSLLANQKSEVENAIIGSQNRIIRENIEWSL